MTQHPFDVPLRLPDEMFVFQSNAPIDNDKGMRASESCPVARGLRPIFPDRYHSFNPGVATMGHVMEQIWIHQTFKGVDHTPQFEVAWNVVNTTHIDCVVHEGPWQGVWEGKTMSDPEPKSNAAGRAQVRRGMYLREQEGITLPGDCRIVAIGKAGHQSGWARDGGIVEPLTDDDRTLIAADFALSTTVNDYASAPGFDFDKQPPSWRDSCNCGQCWPKPERTYMEKLDDMLDYEYHALVGQSLTRDEWKALEKDLKTFNDKAKAVMAAANVTHAETGFYNVTLDKRNACKIALKPLSEVLA